MSDLDMGKLVEGLKASGLNPVVIDENTEFEQQPFISGTNIQYAWDATSLESFKRCPRLYYYEMVCGYRQAEENVHLRFGAHFHKALHVYELSKAGGDMHEDCVWAAVRKTLEDTIGWNSDHKTKNRESLIRVIVKYFEKFKHDPAETLIMDNGSPAVEVNFNFELDYGPTPDQPYVLCGYLDKIVRFNGEVFFKDFKTSIYPINDRFFNQFSPNTQMSLYTIACKVIFETVIRGGIITAAQIKADDVEFGQGFIYRTNDQIDEWLADLKITLNEAKAYADNGYWPMRDTSCDKYGGCKMRDICNKSPRAREAFLKSKFKVERWNPLQPR